jgi:hypothetical protein
MTTLTVERDPETGLAALPEGYIWRVRSERRYLGLTLVRVMTETKYRAKWLFFGSEEYTETTEQQIRHDFFDTYDLASPVRTKERVAKRLAKLSATMYTEWRNQQDEFDMLESFSGDYPPKNLHSV